MKKALLLIVSILTIFTLFSCKASENANQSAGGTQSEGVTEGVLYAPGTNLKIVYSDESLSGYVNQILYSVGANMTTVPSVALDTMGDVVCNEIVIGRTTRSISATAYARLERMEDEENE